MRHRTTLPLVLALLVAPCVSANAQTAEELAQQYIEMPQVQEMISEMFSPQSAIDQMTAMMGPAAANLTDEQKAEIGKLMSAKFNEMRPAMEKSMQDAAATSFSPEELKALMEFYGSDIGASVMKKMPAYQQKAMTALAPQFQKMIMELVPQIQAIVGKK